MKSSRENTYKEKLHDVSRIAFSAFEQSDLSKESVEKKISDIKNTINNKVLVTTENISTQQHIVKTALTKLTTIDVDLYLNKWEYENNLNLLLEKSTNLEYQAFKFLWNKYETTPIQKLLKADTYKNIHDEFVNEFKDYEKLSYWKKEMFKMYGDLFHKVTVLDILHQFKKSQKTICDLLPKKKMRMPTLNDISLDADDRSTLGESKENPINAQTLKNSIKKSVTKFTSSLIETKEANSNFEKITEIYFSTLIGEQLQNISILTNKIQSLGDENTTRKNSFNTKILDITKEITNDINRFKQSTDFRSLPDVQLKQSYHPYYDFISHYTSLSLLFKRIKKHYTDELAHMENQQHTDQNQMKEIKSLYQSLQTNEATLNLKLLEKAHLEHKSENESKMNAIIYKQHYYMSYSQKWLAFSEFVKTLNIDFNHDINVNMSSAFYSENNELDEKIKQTEKSMTLYSDEFFPHIPSNRKLVITKVWPSKLENFINCYILTIGDKDTFRLHSIDQHAETATPITIDDFRLITTALKIQRNSIDTSLTLSRDQIDDLIFSNGHHALSTLFKQIDLAITQTAEKFNQFFGSLNAKTEKLFAAFYKTNKSQFDNIAQQYEQLLTQLKKLSPPAVSILPNSMYTSSSSSQSSISSMSSNTHMPTNLNLKK